MKCKRCNRTLRHPVYVAGMMFGAKCAAMLYGAKPGRASRKAAKDERQAELFAEEQRERETMVKVRELIGTISLEMRP